MHAHIHPTTCEPSLSNILCASMFYWIRSWLSGVDVWRWLSSNCTFLPPRTHQKLPCNPCSLCILGSSVMLNHSKQVDDTCCCLGMHVIPIWIFNCMITLMSCSSPQAIGYFVCLETDSNNPTVVCVTSKDTLDVIILIFLSFWCQGAVNQYSSILFWSPTRPILFQCSVSCSATKPYIEITFAAQTCDISV